MICYLDASVVLRHLFGDSGAYRPWGGWTEAYSSTLLEIESLRAIDRLRISNQLSDLETVRYIAGLHRILTHVSEISMNNAIFKRASQPFSVVVGTLDALHCATASSLQTSLGTDVVVLTHDKQMGIAAQSMGLQAQGF